MSSSLKFRDLRNLSEEELESRFREILHGAATGDPTETLSQVETEIKVLEERLGAKAEAVLEDLKAGRCRETWEVCQLLMLMSRRDRLIRASKE